MCLVYEPESNVVNFSTYAMHDMAELVEERLDLVVSQKRWLVCCWFGKVANHRANGKLFDFETNLLKIAITKVLKVDLNRKM